MAKAAELPAKSILADAIRLQNAAAGPLGQTQRSRAEAKKAYATVRDKLVRQQLESIPLSKLKDTTDGRVRLGVIESAGYKTVASVLDAGEGKLYRIHGVGEQSVRQVVAAARQLEKALEGSVRVRFDADKKPKEHAALLKALAGYDVAQATIGPLEDDLGRLVQQIEGLSERAERTTSKVKMFISGPRKREDARAALAELNRVLRDSRTHLLEERLDKAKGELARADKKAPSAIWQDFESRVARYNGLLIDIGGQAADTEAGQGYLSAEIAKAVHEHPLDVSLLNVSLRGYQAFGAKFALVQKKAILGDEMGLGKTVEALASICHLAVDGKKHFLVVSPASVLVNWLHETQRHTQLEAFRLYGPDRDVNLKLWARKGGVAATTFEALKTMQKPEGVKIAMLVVDEAHYVKNPDAQRTQAVKKWIGFSDRTLFLTGTPMENRIDEFKTLVHHLQPKIAGKVDAMDALIGAARFRSTVAPVYLRRNQADVLQELPDRIDTEEWVDFDGADLAAYRDAVASGNFMAMRQAAYAPGAKTGSAKLTRLLEIVEESAEADRKIVVFSYFRGVLATIAAALGDIALDPLTGSVPPAQRQKLVDDFTKRKGSAVLVSQIEAGGVGLNIQAASVVILAEPQWKPTTEDQAIARAHRMGQARTVNVHRLLAENSVDQRILEILRGKSALFDEYVRRSDLKDSTPDAVDVSDMEATKSAATDAELKRRIVELERKRLGLDAEAEIEVDEDGGT